MRRNLSVVFHPDYTVSLPPGHRFPIGKFGKIRELLLKDCVVSSDSFINPQPVTRLELSLAHSKSYIDRIMSLSLDKKEERRIGLPLSQGLVRRGCAAVGGTIMTARLALDEGVACNVAGGSHHAFPSHGAGFCLFNDVAVAIRLLAKESKIQNALVIDFDVHQGDGTAAFFKNEPEFYTFSLHCQENYPPKKQVSDLDIGVPAGTGDSIYLSVVQTHVQPLIQKLSPDIVFYNAGVDPHQNDKLGKLKLTDAGLRARDDHVIESCLVEGVPLACVVGGGYDNDLDTLARRHGTLHRAAVSALRKLS